MRRILVTGAAGMLGQDLVSVLSARDDIEIRPATRADLDITNLEAVTAAVEGCDVVVNCAAWTAVDDAESHEAEAFAVNAVGPANLARACARSGAWLAHISTDYVFSGDATEPYSEDAPIAPRSAYGRTKAAGEWAVRAELPDRHWILRTAWLYGEHGPSFVRTMVKLEQSRKTVDVVNDQWGQPTWSKDLALRMFQVIESRIPAGTYHATASGAATWYQFARAVFETAGADPERVRPTTSAAFIRSASRPRWSVLGHDAWMPLRMDALPDWQESLVQAALKFGISTHKQSWT